MGAANLPGSDSDAGSTGSTSAEGSGGADLGVEPEPVVAARAAADAAATTAAAGVAAGTAETGTTSGGAEETLREALARSARRFTRVRLDAQDGEAMLRAIVAGALEAIPSVASASISLIDRDGSITTCAPSDVQVAEIDGIQAELGEGPCIDALRETGDDVTDVPDLTDPAHLPWPRLASRAREVGFGSVLSFQLVAQGSAGALNLWGGRPGCFTDHDRLLGALFADQAAVALAGARRVDALQRGLASRDMIGRAKGVLMERFRVPDAAAFAMLVESSQHTNIKLADVASWLVGEAEVTYAREAAAPPVRSERGEPGGGDGRGLEGGDR